MAKKVKEVMIPTRKVSNDVNFGLRAENIRRKKRGDTRDVKRPGESNSRKLVDTRMTAGGYKDKERLERKYGRY